ncbi:MAG: DNA-processing protein DprA [Gemmatimonadetes bacterium]|nr:DNA-processing protein DprA [Gemmatimonadota bacterium]
MNPWDLMTGDIHEQLTEWSDKSITLERLKRLLDRGGALAIAMEKWTGAGLWVLTREDYPKRFKKRLGNAAPIVVFGSGNKSMLKDGGLAVVGSRNAAEEDLAYSSGVGVVAAGSGLTVVSGGARGVDESAMLGALANCGNVIGVLADNLLRTSSSLKYRRHLQDQNLVLISTTNPESGFNTAKAMERNKYIYCLSDAAIVVHSGVKGGTWTGAMENHRKKWVPTWVKRTADRKAGNEDIVNRGGGQWAPYKIADVVQQVRLSVDTSNQTYSEAESKLVIGEGKNLYSGIHADLTLGLETDIQKGGDASDDEVAGEYPDSNAELHMIDKNLGFYEVFISKVRILCENDPKNRTQLADILQLKKTQLDEWLNQAVLEGKLEKLSKPVRYIWRSAEQGKIF